MSGVQNDACGSGAAGTANVVASLVLDSRASARRLGVRDVGDGSGERRLLYCTTDAHIELRVPHRTDESGEPSWLHGQVVSLAGDAASDAPAAISIETPADASSPSPSPAPTVVDGAVAGTGDFALPCDPSRPFTLKYRRAGVPPVVVRYTP